MGNLSCARGIPRYAGVSARMCEQVLNNPYPFERRFSRGDLVFPSRGGEMFVARGNETLRVVQHAFAIRFLSAVDPFWPQQRP